MGERVAGLQQPHPYFFTAAPFKLVLLSICSLGLYELYWFYKNWYFYRARTGKPIKPLWRAFFSPLWAYASFRTVNEAAVEYGLRRSRPGDHPFKILDLFYKNILHIDIIGELCMDKIRKGSANPQSESFLSRVFRESSGWVVSSGLTTGLTLGAVGDLKDPVLTLCSAALVFAVTKFASSAMAIHSQDRLAATQPQAKLQELPRQPGQF